MYIYTIYLWLSLSFWSCRRFCGIQDDLRLMFCCEGMCSANPSVVATSLLCNCENWFGKRIRIRQPKLFLSNYFPLCFLTCNFLPANITAMNSASTGVLFRTSALSIFISTRSHVRHDACDFSISVEGGGKDKLLLNACHRTLPLPRDCARESDVIRRPT